MTTSSLLILAKWADTSNLDKMMRLVEHIDWADKHGNLPKVSPLFTTSLSTTIITFETE